MRGTAPKVNRSTEGPLSQGKHWFIKSISLFSDLSDSELLEMERVTRMQEVKKRQPIYLPGDPSTTIYLLKKGRVKIAGSSPSGKEVTYEILEPGEIFGELDAMEGSPHDMMAEALDDVVICAIKRDDFDRYVQKHPHLNLRLTKLIGFKFRKLESRLADLVCRDVHARLAHLLLDLSKTSGSPHGHGIRINAKLTHHEMANLIGCARETVSTILGEFRDNGLIKIDGRSITIVNSSELSRQMDKPVASKERRNAATPGG